MLWGLRGWKTRLRARLSVTSLASILLWPTVILGSLVAAAVYFAVPSHGWYAVVTFILFSVCFPGTSKLHARFVDIVRDVVAGRTILAALLLLLRYISSYLDTFSCLLSKLFYSTIKISTFNGFALSLRPKNLTCTKR